MHASVDLPVVAFFHSKVLVTSLEILLSVDLFQAVALRTGDGCTLYPL